MSRTANLYVLLLASVVLSVVPSTSTVWSQGSKEKIWQIIHTSQDILAGKNVQQAQTTIAEGARLVYGARFEKLQAVVAGEIRGLSLADTSYHGVMIQAQTNPSEDAGFLILKTQKYDTTKVRFHTIVFMKDSTGKYQISSWHSGACNP